jgi:hypothetical protein
VMDKNSFHQLIRSVNLGAQTPSESEVMKRFEQNPSGPGFVSIADMLRKRGYLDESTAVLEDGVARFPSYFSAQASLAKNYFQKGLFQKSLDFIQIVLAKSPDNLMAQRLRLRLSVFFNEQDVALSRIEILKRLAPDDEFTKQIRISLEQGLWEQCPSILELELKQQGIPYDSSHFSLSEKEQIQHQSAEFPQWSHGNSNSQLVVPKLDENFIQKVLDNSKTEDEAFRAQNTSQVKEELGTSLQSDLYTELNRFKKSLSEIEIEEKPENQTNTFQLQEYSETQALADIYLSQGLLEKSIELLTIFISKNNESLEINIAQQKLVELNVLKKNKDQKQEIKSKKVIKLKSMLEKF